MAERRGSAADLREALMALVRTTLDQVGAVRDVAVRQAQNQRSFLDQALLARRRKDALAALGEEIYARMLDGELAELATSPSIAELIAELGELDDSLAAPQVRADEAPAQWDRSRARHGTRRPGGARVWRPGNDPDAETDAGEARSRPSRRRHPAGDGDEHRGGIAFVGDAEDGDDDLHEFMNDDDVPDTES